MKAYFDEAGNLVIEGENPTERVALHLWMYSQFDNDITFNELVSSKTFGLRTLFGDKEFDSAAEQMERRLNGEVANA